MQSSAALRVLCVPAFQSVVPHRIFVQDYGESLASAFPD